VETRNVYEFQRKHPNIFGFHYHTRRLIMFVAPPDVRPHHDGRAAAGAKPVASRLERGVRLAKYAQLFSRVSRRNTSTTWTRSTQSSPRFYPQSYN
jgi:hypothetical protein